MTATLTRRPYPRFPASPVRWRNVMSSNVDKIGWAGNDMYVVFLNGSIYRYIGVTRQRAVACAYAASVGGYLAKNIKPHFPAVGPL